MRQITLLSRPGCELCEHLEEQLHQRFAGRFVLDWRDVDRQPAWRREYGEQIPVLLGEGGQLLSVGELDEHSVAGYLAGDD